jgi:hypothetical protein
MGQRVVVHDQGEGLRTFGHAPQCADGRRASVRDSGGPPARGWWTGHGPAVGRAFINANGPMYSTRALTPPMLDAFLRRRLFDRLTPGEHELLRAHLTELLLAGGFPAYRGSRIDGDELASVAILQERARIKRQTLMDRRLRHHAQAA